MTRFRCFPALALAAILAAPLSVRAVEFKDLTQDLIRARVKEYLARPLTAAKLESLAPLFTTRADQIVYTAVGGVPQKLEWRFQTGPAFDPKRFPEIKDALRGILEEVLMRYNGGLLSERDGTFLLMRTTYVATPGLVVPPPLPAAARVAVVPSPAATVAPYVFADGWRYHSYPTTWWTYPPTCYWWQYPWWSSPWWAYPYWSYSWYPPYPRYTPILIAETPRAIRAADIAANRSATSLYSEALSCYWGRDAESAAVLLSAAVERDANDARLWYFKALAERLKGDMVAAKESARRGAALELLGRGDGGQLGVALERVQGADRQFLHSAMTADLTIEKAREIAAMPAKPTPPVATAK